MNANCTFQGDLGNSSYDGCFPNRHSFIFFVVFIESDLITSNDLIIFLSYIDRLYFYGKTEKCQNVMPLSQYRLVPPAVVVFD